MKNTFTLKVKEEERIMKKETRTFRDEIGRIHTATDCYSNAKNEYEASKCVLGRNISRQEFEEERQYVHLIIEDGGSHGRYYVCYID